MGRLENRTAIVTGAAMGIGLGIARVLTREGAAVSLFDVDDGVFAAAREVGGAAAFQVDIRDGEALRAAADDVEAQFGRVDILVNNAGILRVVPFLEMSDEVRDLHIDTNLKGTWNCCQAFLPHMLKRHYGKIVNLSSVTGTQVADPGETAYGLTKAGIWGFTKALAMEFASAHINVNMICPGVFRTPMVESLAQGTSPEDVQATVDLMAATIPMGRLGRPDEIGHLAAYLASDEAEYVTGQAFCIDGGSTLPETSAAVG